MVTFPVHQVWPKPSREAQWKGEEDEADRGRGGKTTSGNGRAWSSASPRGQWRTGENGKKMVAKSSVVPQRPSRLRNRWWWWWTLKAIQLGEDRGKGDRKAMDLFQHFVLFEPCLQFHVCSAVLKEWWYWTLGRGEKHEYSYRPKIKVWCIFLYWRIFLKCL